MNRITLCEEIASAIASRIGFDSSAEGAAGAAGASLNIGIGSNCGLLDMECSWLSGGLDLGGNLRLQREGVDRAADLRPEDVVH